MVSQWMKQKLWSGTNGQLMVVTWTHCTVLPFVSETVGAEKDFRKSLDLLQKAAEIKNARALFKFGQLYEDGIEVPKDLSQCIEYYRKASRLNHKEAEFAVSPYHL
jgi:TPR repeat protein